MNERIQELFNKACVYAYEQNPGENSYGRPVDENKYEEDRYTKFAELIVQECIECADVVGKANYVSSYPNSTAYHIKQKIKEHFGVEE